LQSKKKTKIPAKKVRQKATVLEHTVQVIQDATDRQLIEEFAIDRNNFQQFQVTLWMIAYESSINKSDHVIF
jgi:hypothetical protein